MTTDKKLPILKNASVQANGRINGQLFNDDRWEDGTWVNTSPIQSVKTLNTEYIVEFKE